jgi:hypothetical protein
MSTKEKKSRKKNNIVKQEFNHEVDAVKKITDNAKPPQTSLKEIETKILKVNFPDYNHKNILLQYIYNDEIKESNEQYDINYRNTIKERITRALGIYTIRKDFKTLISIYDKNNEDLPRGEVLTRLNQFYDILVDFGLVLIHNFLYDIKAEQVIASLGEAIIKVSPILFDLKKKFEDQVHGEFTFTNTELDILKLG